MHHFTIWSVLICIDLITVGEECHHSHIYITSNLPLHCLNPTYNALLFWQTSDILLYEEANELYQNHPMKLYPIPDKPYMLHSTPDQHYTLCALHHSTPDKQYTQCALHLCPYTWCRLTVTTPDVRWCALHLTYTRCALHLTDTTLTALHLMNITLMVALVANMLWQLDCSCPQFSAATTADTGHMLVQI